MGTNRSRDRISLLQAVFSWMFLLGAVIIVLGFVGVAILEQLGAWDPIWAKIKKLSGTHM